MLTREVVWGAGALLEVERCFSKLDSLELGRLGLWVHELHKLNADILFEMPDKSMYPDDCDEHVQRNLGDGTVRLGVVSRSTPLHLDLL